MSKHQSSHKEQSQRTVHSKLTMKLLLAVVAMFGFGYALVPLYDIMCEQLGINGKTSEVAATIPNALEVDTSRVIRIELMSHINSGMHWDFYPNKQVIDVHPGEVIQTHFVAKNRTEQAMVAQAVPSVSPGMGASYFNKVECFCFNQQPLAAQQQTDMGLLFYIEPDVPDNIHTLTLSYTLFDITEAVNSSQEVISQTSSLTDGDSMWGAFDQVGTNATAVLSDTETLLQFSDRLSLILNLKD